MDAAVSDATEKFRKGADFLFGVLIGLSLENAVVGFLHVSARKLTGESESHAIFLSGPGTSWLAAARLFVFAALIANFYFGSIKFFDDTYGRLGSAVPKGFANRFEADVFSGLIHFGLIYAWSFTISAPDSLSLCRCIVTESAFFFMLMLVLSYDLIWLGWRSLATLIFHHHNWKGQDKETHGRIWSWTWKNLLVVGGSITLAYALGGHWKTTELISGAAAFLLNLWEFTGIVT